MECKRNFLALYPLPPENCASITLCLLVFVCATFSSGLVMSQPLPGPVPPGLLERAKDLSPAERAALARQYGIDVELLTPEVQATPTLGTPGEPLTAVDLFEDEDDLEGEPEPVAEIEDAVADRFGMRFFRQEVSTFAPTDDAVIPGDYKLGIGDNLVVQLYGKENEELTLQVDRSGAVRFPRLGPIFVVGLSFDDARALIQKRIEEQLIGVKIAVSMGSLRAINIFMAGEVGVPGSYSVSALTTITQALYQAGGVSEIGSLRRIQVMRSGSVAASFDAYDLLHRGDSSGDVRLQSGDVVFVPTLSGVIDIQGEVLRPMRYEILGGESIAEVLEMAGSSTRNAFLGLATVVRQRTQSGLSSLLTVDLMSSEASDFEILDGDEIFIPSKASLVAGSISVDGAVVRAGAFGWREGMRVSDLLSNAREDLLPNADLNAGIVVRSDTKTLDISVETFNVASAIKSPQSDQDLVLEEYDQIVVLPLAGTEDFSADDAMSRRDLLDPIIAKLVGQARENSPVQTISISGSVRDPGTFPLAKGMTLSDLIRIAGGFEDFAFTESVELRRLQVRPDGAVTARYESIDLSETDNTAGAMQKMLSRDHVTVREIPDWSPDEEVIIAGEVRFPGAYRILPGERLSSLIERAGGLTRLADPRAARFKRVSIAELERERAQSLVEEIRETFAARLLTEERPGQNLMEIDAILAALSETEGTGRLLIDLPAAMAKNAVSDIELMDGDEITIPPLSKVISIIGEVKRPSNHTFRSSLTYEDYIDLSAGVTRRADVDGIYIVKVDGSVVPVQGSVWRFSESQIVLEAGDTVVVPINTSYKDSLSSWNEITQVIYQSVVSLAAVARL